MDIVVTRYIGIRGTAILAREKQDELIKRYPLNLVEEAMAFDEGLSGLYLEGTADDNKCLILKDITIAQKSGAVYADEYTEFGIFEALFKMSKVLKCGLRVNIRDIPIKQETVEVCELFGVNPYAFYSGASAVIVCEDGEKTVSLLEEEGIPAAIVGCTTYEDNDKIVVNSDEQGFLQHIRKDELKNILGRREYYERTNSVNC